LPHCRTILAALLLGSLASAIAVRAGAGAEAGVKPEPSIELESVNRELGQSTVRQDGLKDAVAALDAEPKERSERVSAIGARTQGAEGRITAAGERVAKLGGRRAR